MNANLSQLEAIFHEALTKSPAERTAYLASACEGNADLRQRVDALLAAHAERGDFLGGTSGATVHYAEQKPAAGNLIAGKYKLLQIIGEGGMGTVHVAEQMHPIRRKVAVKIIKPGMDSKSVLARFEAERQALALMDHPNIAQVLDGGVTENGLPFFVMELVKGTPITHFCDERKLSPRDRLELFVPVCQAIQHAHQKGIIHRDIKPSNVLVALYDERPVPKIIDFGIAKATGQALTEQTLHTTFGTIVGTPEYMSPEQATFNQLDIDTRSDVYALGVLLYELLTGATPVDKARLGKAAVLEVLRIVREEEPARPSVKLTTSEARASIAATRGTGPDKLSKQLRGELDWIVMKSLEKDRNRRYDTATALARDIQRYLADEMVEARPPSLRYRLAKSLSRNRGSVLAAALLLLTLIAGVIGTTWGLFRALDAERDALTAKKQADDERWDAVEQRGLALAAKMEASEAAQQATKAQLQAEENEKSAKASALEAQAVNQFLQYAMLLTATKAPDAKATLRQFVETAEPLVKTMFKDQPRNEAKARLLFGQMYAFGDAREEAVRQLDLALSLPGLTPAEMHMAVTAYGRAGDPEKGINAAKEMLDRFLKSHGTDHPLTLTTHLQLGVFLEFKGKFAEAESHWRAAAAGYRRQVSKIPNANQDLSHALDRLAACLVMQSKPVDAVPVLHERLKLLEKLDARKTPAWVTTTTTLADCLRRTEKFTEAESTLLTMLKVFGLLDGKKTIANESLQSVNQAILLLAEIYEETKQPNSAAKWRGILATQP